MKIIAMGMIKIASKTKSGIKKKTDAKTSFIEEG